jgi:hypothetical protein
MGGMTSVRGELLGTGRVEDLKHDLLAIDLHLLSVVVGDKDNDMKWMIVSENESKLSKIETFEMVAKEIWR